MSKIAKLSLKNATLALAGVAVAATLAVAPASAASASGGGFSASDGQWQQTLNRYGSLTTPTHGTVRTIDPLVVHQPAVPR